MDLSTSPYFQILSDGAPTVTWFAQCLVPAISVPLSVPLLLGVCNEGGVGQIHRPVSALVHEAGTAFDRRS